MDKTVGRQFDVGDRVTLTNNSKAHGTIVQISVKYKMFAVEIDRPGAPRWSWVMEHQMLPENPLESISRCLPTENL